MCGRDNSTAIAFTVPYDPERGLRFNSSKLLLDPYAKAIAGEINWSDEMFGYVVGDRERRPGAGFSRRRLGHAEIGRDR